MLEMGIFLDVLMTHFELPRLAEQLSTHHRATDGRVEYPEIVTSSRSRSCDKRKWIGSILQSVQKYRSAFRHSAIKSAERKTGFC